MSNADLLMALCGPVGRVLAKRPLTEIFGMAKPRQSECFAGETVAEYVVHPQIAAAKELYLRTMAEVMVSNTVFTDPSAMKTYIGGRIGSLPYEVFCTLYLDSQLRLITFDESFRGTLTQTSVYPRELAKRALDVNAAAVVFAHNHPSGSVQPSRADEALTQTLKIALALIDVRCLDHIVVSGNTSFSMAERGLI